MKIKLELDIEDLMNDVISDNAEFDSDCGVMVDFDLKEEITREIVRLAKDQVLKKITEPVRMNIHDQVKGLVISEYGKIVSNKVDEFVKNGTVKQYSNSGEDIPVNSWIEKTFKDKFDSGSELKGIVTKKCDEISKEIKERYDLFFASSLVSKLNEQGLLKDGVFKALMSKEN